MARYRRPLAGNTGRNDLAHCEHAHDDAEAVLGIHSGFRANSYGGLGDGDMCACACCSSIRIGPWRGSFIRNVFLRKLRRLKGITKKATAIRSVFECKTQYKTAKKCILNTCCWSQAIMKWLVDVRLVVGRLRALVKMCC